MHRGTELRATADERHAAVVGREDELALLRAFARGGGSARALVLTAEPGMGKTTLWEAGIAAARESAVRVLVARASGAEAQLSFAALTDLLDGVDTEALDGLPPPQRHALDVALLRAEPLDTAAEPRAIALAVLNTLRALAAREPVLIAIDDVQWLDAASAEALTFAARRLDQEPVRFLLATRPTDSLPLEQALARSGLERVDVGPLSLGAIRRLLSERCALTLPRRVLSRIVDATGGNPLFAIEVGRSIGEHGAPEIGDDVPVPPVVEDLLGTRVARLRPPLRRVLLILALSSELRASQLAQVTDGDALREALVAGLVVAEGDSVRPAHPLLAAAAKERSRPDERRDVHAMLARAVADAESRARHLALAAERPDADLATAIAAAAADAAARGARQVSVELAEHALRLTPASSLERGDRVLALATYLEAAGERQRVTDVLAPELDSLARGAARVRAELLLSEGGGVTSAAAHERHLERALAESGDDDALRAHVLAKKAIHVTACCVERTRQAEAWASEALPGASRAGPDVERLALHGLAWARSLRGQWVDNLCERFHAISPEASHITDSPDQVAALRLAWRGEVARARPILTRLLALADERGEAVSYALQRLNLCDVELRAGEWDDAERLLDEWAAESGRTVVAPTYERCRALLAAGRGRIEEAERWAASALAGGEPIGVRWQVLEALRARGIAALLNHEPARAAESLRAVFEHTEREGVTEPGAFPVAPDLVESLVELRELDEAREVTRRLRELAEGQDHPWGLASANRCAALVGLAANTYDETAAAGLAAAVAAYGELGLRFDHARSLLALGRAQRRLRKWGAARRSLADAAAAFDAIGSPGWAEDARAELTRVGARRPPPTGELTATERRVVGLAAEGLSNKEIAQALVVTVHTVEVHLSHAYAKLGVRSRGQLARRLADGAA